MSPTQPGACAHSGTRVVYFHHVGRQIDHYTSISATDFARALDVLADAAEIIDLRDYLRETPDIHPGDPDAKAARRVVLTFDDGYAETLETVLPLLEARGLTAAFFVVPNWFGRRVPHGWAPDTLVCGDTAALLEIQTRGHAVASHTWSHQRLDELGLDDVHRELISAEAALAGLGLGSDLRGTVAYPYGRIPRTPLTGLVRYGFATAREPHRCLHCDPLGISRVYLDTYDVGGWSDAIAAWW